MKCSSVNVLPLKRNFCCLHERKQNLTLSLVTDTNSGFPILSHVVYGLQRIFYYHLDHIPFKLSSPAQFINLLVTKKNLLGKADNFPKFLTVTLPAFYPVKLSPSSQIFKSVTKVRYFGNVCKLKINDPLQNTYGNQVNRSTNYFS